MTIVCAQVNHQTEELNKLVVTFVILKTRKLHVLSGIWMPVLRLGRGSMQKSSLRTHLLMWKAKRHLPISHVGVNQCFNLFSAFQYRLQKSGIFGRMSERRARSKLSFEKRTELLHAFSSSLFPVLGHRPDICCHFVLFQSLLASRPHWQKQKQARTKTNTHAAHAAHAILYQTLHLPMHRGEA